LAATVRKARPELLSDVEVEGSSPIPDEIPKNFFAKQTFHVEDIGEPVSACFFTTSSIDPTNWYKRLFFSRGISNPDVVLY